MSSKVFISYSHNDYYSSDNKIIEGNPIVHIRKTLQKNNIEFWMDDKISPGDAFSKNVGEAIKSCDIFLFVSSYNSNLSEWAQGEIHTARNLNKRIVPFNIDHSEYNISYSLYLAHLDFIDYSANRQTALSKLVEIAQVQMSKITLPDMVSYKAKGRDLMFGDVKLSDKIQALFSALSLSSAADCYLDIVDKITALADGESINMHHVRKIVGRSKDYIQPVKQRLKHFPDFSSPDLQRKMLLDVATSMIDGVEKTDRTDRILLQLGLMMCYYYLGENKALKKVQEDISASTFDQTFWEKNGGDIQQAGSVILSIAASFLVPTNPGGLIKAGDSGGRQANDAHKENLMLRQQYFEALRDTIASIKFI
jgi:hypothetical protein